MKIPSLVKLPRNRQFRFKPRHYDPVQEDLEERVTQIREEMGEENSPENQRKTHINFRNKVNQKGSNQTRYIRIAVIVFLLGNGYAWLMFGYALIFKIILLVEVTIAYIWYRVQKRKKNSIE